jgi:hypothetical protein
MKLEMNILINEALKHATDIERMIVDIKFNDSVATTYKGNLGNAPVGLEAEATNRR